jgi:hypothetical protein
VLLVRSQVAPTAKIPDEAPMPMPAPAAPEPQYSTQPPQMPAPIAPFTASTPRIPSPSEASLGERPRGRRWGLVAFILLVDLGLAGAGAWMWNESRRADAGGSPPIEGSK